MIQQGAEIPETCVCSMVKQHLTSGSTLTLDSLQTAVKRCPSCKMIIWNHNHCFRRFLSKGELKTISLDLLDSSENYTIAHQTTSAAIHGWISELCRNKGNVMELKGRQPEKFGEYQDASTEPLLYCSVKLPQSIIEKELNSFGTNDYSDALRFTNENRYGALQLEINKKLLHRLKPKFHFLGTKSYTFEFTYNILVDTHNVDEDEMPLAMNKESIQCQMVSQSARTWKLVEYRSYTQRFQLKEIPPLDIDVDVDRSKLKLDLKFSSDGKWTLPVLIFPNELQLILPETPQDADADIVYMRFNKAHICEFKFKKHCEDCRLWYSYSGDVKVVKVETGMDEETIINFVNWIRQHTNKEILYIGEFALAKFALSFRPDERSGVEDILTNKLILEKEDLDEIKLFWSFAPNFYFKHFHTPSKEE